MVMPSGRRSSDPGPVAMTRGTAPKSAAIVVIMIGRKRSRQASKIARSGGRACLRSPSSAKSTIMIPFFLTMPIKRIIPMNAIRESSALKICRAKRAPRPAEGDVDGDESGQDQERLRPDRYPIGACVAGILGMQRVWNVQLRDRLIDQP